MFKHQKITMKRDWFSWPLRPGWTRHPGRKPILFAGPWVGEFGWELLNWQGWVRALAPHYKRVIVCSRASSEALYADVASDFVPHTLRGNADHVILRKLENPEELERIQHGITPDMDHLLPRVYVPTSAQSFIRFGTAQRPGPAEVMIHARGRGAATQRNWSVENWLSLVTDLQAKGLRVGCVGLRGATLDVPGVEDFRDRPLAETMDLLACARVVLGPSSGPMHLASLCGTPHIVWTNRGIYRMGKTSRQKYETWWNPLRTPVRVLDDEGFGVAPERVAQAVEEILTRLPGIPPPGGA